MNKIKILLFFFTAINLSQDLSTNAELIEKSETQYELDLRNSIVKNISFQNRLVRKRKRL